MRSLKPRVLTCYKSPTHGQPPSYISLAHRHFEKAKTEGARVIASAGSNLPVDSRSFVIPVDLLRLTIPPELVNEIESIEVVYGR